MTARGHAHQIGTAAAGGRPRVSHSLEAIVAAAVAILDEAGEPALTFRALAARLGGGVASLYWYVSSKDELLDHATDHVLGGVLAEAQQLPGTDDPIADVRAIAIRLFEAIVDRPWLAAYLMRDTGTQPNSLRLYDLIGRQVMRLGLPPRESFHAVSAIVGFVVGIAADLGQQRPPEVADGSVTREEYLAQHVDRWRLLDAETYPFVRYIVEEFAVHDDADQFRAGLDLLLAGLERQATA